MKRQFLVFISCMSGETYDVGRAIALKHDKSIGAILSVTGEWDLLLHIFVDHQRDVGLELTQLLRDIEGIQRTNTIAAFPVFDPGDVEPNGSK